MGFRWDSVGILVGVWWVSGGFKVGFGGVSGGFPVGFLEASSRIRDLVDPGGRLLLSARTRACSRTGVVTGFTSFGKRSQPEYQFPLGELVFGRVLRNPNQLCTP